MKAIIKAPWIFVGLILAGTVFFAYQLQFVELDNDVLTFVPEEHPAKVAFDEMDERYNANLAMVVAVEDPRGTILDVEGVSLVQSLTGEFETIANVEAVDSLTTIDYIEATDEGMRSGPLVEDFGGTAAEVDELRRRLQSWELYDGALVSNDQRSTQIVVQVPANLEEHLREDVYFQILERLEPYRAQGYRFYVAGEPVLAVLMSQNMVTDVRTLIPVVTVVVLLSLLIFFRRLGGVALPLITVLVSTVWTIGLMALLGVKLSLVATVIPVLMIAVGSAYGIHIINHYYEETNDLEPDPQGRLSRDQVSAAVERTVKHVGTAVAMAGVTTVAGFGSLATSEVGPMRDFGIFTAIGVAVALLVALTLIPALLVLQRRPRPRRRRADGSTTLIPRGFLISLYHFFGRRKHRILVAAVAIALAAAWGSLHLVVDNELIAYFKEDTDVRQADTFLRENFLGTRSFDINVVGQEAGDLTNPEILKAMDDLADWMETRYPERVARVLSYSDFVKRMNQVMNTDRPSPYGPLPGVATPAAAPGTAAPGTAAPDAAPPATDTAPDPAGRGFSSGGFSGDGFSAGEDDGAGFGSAGDGLFGAALRGDTAGQPGSPSPPASTDAGGAGTGAAVDASSIQTMVGAAIAEAVALSETGAISGDDLADLVMRRLNYRGAAYYEVPYDPAHYPAQTREELSNLITQYLLLYSGELDEFADDALEPRQARMRVQLRTTGNIFTQELIPEIETFVAQEFPQGYTVEIAGIALVEQAITELITGAQVRSIAVSIVLVFLIVAITFRSLVAGLYGVIPLALTLLVNFGVMGFAGIKLDITTAMVASIAIGIGIDYTIHFLSSYHIERRRSASLEDVELRVLSTTGKAIVFNAVSVAAGFAVLVFSQFNPLAFMGALIALTMLTSSIASMTLLPVLLDVFKPKFMQPRNSGEQGGNQ